MSWARCRVVMFSVLRSVVDERRAGCSWLMAWCGKDYLDGYFSIEGAHVSAACSSAMFCRPEVFAFTIDGYHSV